MPIKDPSRYPDNWGEIRERILQRAGNRCEGSLVYPDCRVENHSINPRGSRVVLTIAHLNHKPEDCRPDNLRAWCQLCHNTYDAPYRALGRRLAKTERQLQEAVAYSMRLFRLAENYRLPFSARSYTDLAQKSLNLTRELCGLDPLEFDPPIYLHPPPVLGMLLRSEIDPGI